MEKSVLPCYIPLMKGKFLLLLIFSIMAYGCISDSGGRKQDRQEEGPESGLSAAGREDSEPADKEVQKEEEIKKAPEQQKESERDRKPSEKPEAEDITEKEVSQLSLSDIRRLISLEGKDGKDEKDESRPLEKDAEPMVLLHDINENGYSDAVSLFIRTDTEVESPAALERLSDFTRLYSPDAESFGCMVKVFFQEQGTLREQYTVDLGERVVLEGFEEISLAPGGSGPYTISVSFQSHEGSVKEWLFFNGDKPGRFTLRETLSSHHEIRDIDEDGFLDVLRFEKSFEEGMGYETYITWFRWNGETFLEYKVTNVLRKLNSFLDHVREYMIEGKWKLFFDHALSKERVRWYKKKALEPEETLQRIFTVLGEPEDEEKGLSLSQLRIEDVIFPDLLENPFQRTEHGNYIFPLRVRVIAEEGEFVYISRILLLENPFQNPPFSFIMSHEHVYNRRQLSDKR